MKHCYVVLPSAWAETHEGTQVGCNVLTTATTSDGRIVVSLNAVNEFPELFQAMTTIKRVWLSPEDFPQPSETNFAA